MTSARRDASHPRAAGRTRSIIAAYLRQHPGSTPRQIADCAGLYRELAISADLAGADPAEWRNVAAIQPGHWRAPSPFCRTRRLA
jgi:hypothetical protein